MNRKLYELWEKGIPYLVTDEIPSEILSKLGFYYYADKKSSECVNYIEYPKTVELRKALTDKLKDLGYECEIEPYSDDNAKRFDWEKFDEFEWKLQELPEAKQIAVKLIDSDAKFQHLLSANIGYYLKSGKAPYNEKTGQMKFAYASKATGEKQFFSKFDFIIYFFSEVWEVLNPDEKAALVEHELAHCGNRGNYFIKKHDFEDFKTIIDKYGADWGTKPLKRVLTLRNKDEEDEASE